MILMVLQEIKGELTCEEIATLGEVPLQSVTPRMKELEMAGLIQRSILKKKTSTGCPATVWKLTELGRNWSVQ